MEKAVDTGSKVAAWKGLLAAAILLLLANGAVARAPDDIAQSSLNLRDLGAVCDGRKDDTEAIRSWLSRLQTGQRGYAPAGTCLFTAPLQVSTAGIAIQGDGPYQTIFAYAGAAANVDLITIGDDAKGTKNWFLSGFRITSTTKMTAGAGLRLRRFTRSMIENVVIDGQDGSGTLWDGIWFDGVDQVIYRGFEARAQNDALRVNGAVGKGVPKAGLMLHGGKIALSGVGLHVGGAFGGLYVDQVDIIANRRAVVVDTALAEEANREIFFGSLVSIDSTKAGAAVTIADRLAGGHSLAQFTGTWISGGTAEGVLIEPGVKWTVTLLGGTIFNFKGDGIKNQSPSSRVMVNNTLIRFNGGIGINNAGKSPYVMLQAPAFIGNKGAETQGPLKR